MRKHSFIFAVMKVAMLVVMLVIGLALVSCDNGTTGNRTKFEGRWVHLDAIQDGYSDYSFTFSGNNFVFRMVYPGGSAEYNGVFTGTFTFTDDYLIYYPVYGQNWTSFMQWYRLTGKVLELDDPIPDTLNWADYGRYVKQ